MLRPAALALTVLSGFTGLAYEVTWQKYLAILLGAHSEATAAVLGLFLGGLSLGYWLFGALTRRLVERERSLLAVYGGVEAGIGLWCLGFPWTFALVRSASATLPGGEGALGFAVDVALAAALIVPPATLMGGTIPILTQALARNLADATRVHAQIYASNTAGAFAGTLATGFVLIHGLGLEGTLYAMGAVNLAIGAAFAALSRSAAPLAELETEGAPPLGARVFAVYGGIALLVGFAMMVLQTTVIRISGLSFGSSEYTFTIVVAVFVVCIAVGSFAVSAFTRIPRLALPAALWVLAILFSALYFGLETAPYWAHLVRIAFGDTESAFYPFYGGVFLAVLLAIGPAVVFSGAALPLSFHALRREVGELGSQAGRLYSVNTVGSLLGALIGGYALLVWLDLHHVYRIALCALVLAASIATWRQSARIGLAGTAALGIASLIAIAALPPWRPAYLASGVFRERKSTDWTWDGPSGLAHYIPNSRIVFHDDDPNTTVTVREFSQGARASSRSLFVNGKSDGNTTGDYGTMAMLAVVPALFAERAENAFVIGFGTGITAGELSQLAETQSITVAEISSGVIAAAPLFDFGNYGVSRNPKLTFVHSDAYRALVRSARQYDVIISEPSNPWVTGVEMLYSQEFLAAARDHLTPRGVFAQWFHFYDTSDATIELVLETYASVFDHVAVWTVNYADALILGFRDPMWALDLERLAARMQQPDFHLALRRLEATDLATWLAHETLPLGVVHAAALRGPVHSLIHPRLSFVAGRAFFTGGRGSVPFTGYGAPAEIGTANSLLGRYRAQLSGDEAREALDHAAWRACRAVLSNCGGLAAAWANAHPNPERFAPLAEMLRERGPRYLERLQRLLGADPSAPAPSGRIPPDEAIEWTRLYRRAYAHAEPFDPAQLVEVWRRCAPDGEDTGACARGLRASEQLARGVALPDLEAAVDGTSPR